jgi:hypothetical protein
VLSSGEKRGDRGLLWAASVLFFFFRSFFLAGAGGGGLLELVAAGFWCWWRLRRPMLVLSETILGEGSLSVVVFGVAGLRFHQRRRHWDAGA